MHKLEEILEDKKTDKRKPIRHAGCVPCGKRLCGTPFTRHSGRPINVDTEPDVCIVCADIWKSMHCCPSCGRNGNEMWGK